ncbi:MAG TPA: DoxX family protein [Woeseiaceae bacterium]|nr:DoxX family protein [Woeseiaceae bacterium]
MSDFFRRLVTTRAGWGPLVLRVPIGITLMGHGGQKLFGWFGGPGLEGTGSMMAQIGLNPGYVMGLLAGSAEFFGGLLLFIGFLVRPAGAVVGCTMLVAIFAVHFPKGLFLANGGYEYALALLAVSVSLLVSGAGRVSIDEWLARSRQGTVAPPSRDAAGSAA